MAYTISDITSIGWLSAVDHRVNLTPCFNHSAFPVLVNVSYEEYKATDGDREKMKQLAIEKLNN